MPVALGQRDDLPLAPPLGVLLWRSRVDSVVVHDGVRGVWRVALSTPTRRWSADATPARGDDHPSTETHESPTTLRHHVTGGTYTVVYELAEPATVTVGALGDHRLSAGGYAYTGSALGSGGFGRVDRHKRVAAAEHDVRHWHVDYLGGHPAASVHRVLRLPDRDVECAVAQALADGPVAGFGASDCDCASHLAAYPDAEAAVDAVEAVHGRI